MEVPKDVEKFLVANIETLPKDVVVYMTQFMDPADILRLCRTKKSFKDICTKYDIFDKLAYDYVKQNTPFAEPLARIRDQAEAIKRGQVTPYKYIYETKTVHIGIGTNFQTNEDVYFEIKGSPAKKGTKLWLYGYIPGPEQDFIDPGLIYSSPEDLKQDLLDNANRDYGVMDSFLDVYVDQVEDKEPLINTLFEDLKKNGTIDVYFLRQITMP